MTKTSGVRALAFTIASALGCATFSVDASFTKNAIERAAAVSADASSVESAGSDGSRYAYVNAGDNATCFRGIVDDRDGVAENHRFRLRQFADSPRDLIREDRESSVELVRKGHVAQPGVVGTNAFVLDPDGSTGQIVELTEVGYPVAVLEICFRGTSRDPRARFLVLNRERGDSDRAAPSYASWRLP